MPDEQQPALVSQELVAQIVAAYVRKNQIASDQLGSLISTVHDAFSRLDTPLAEPIVERTPAVPIRRSVHQDYVVCLDCGWKGKMLKRHLNAAHGLSDTEYRARWNLKPDHPITALGYSERRSTMAKQLGLGQLRRKTETSPPATKPGAKRHGRPRATTAPAAETENA
jgi:predicted transcriptional regulator